MARIRSIKPEYWKDGKVRRLSDSCALFFIGLWNFCDDDGKCENDSFELASNLARFKSQHVSKWIQILFECGLIQLSTDFRWVSIANWKHQKIDRPKIPSVRKSEIEWLPLHTSDLSTNARRMLDAGSTMNRRMDRKGKDRKGKDRIGSGSEPALFDETNIVVPPKQTPKKDPSAGALAQQFIATYCECFKGRYGSNPDITGKDRGIALRIVKDLGLARARALVDTFLLMQDSFFLLRRHDLTTFESNLKSVAVKHDTGKGVNRIQAVQVERQDANVEAVKAYLASKGAAQ